MSEPLPINTGLCEPWTDADAISGCCAGLATDVDLEMAVEVASDVLYRLSGHRYSGVCESTVRPCASYASCWEPVDHWRTTDCSCRPLSYIRLAGYPVRQILDVTIDGEPVDASGYRLDRNRDLVRMADVDGKAQWWPQCQRLDLPEGEEGTWTVQYLYGLEPPAAGRLAAAELACQIAKSCPTADGSVAGDCELPAGTVRISRQGLTIDTQELGLWMIGALRTGMPLVDAFLATYTAGAPRRKTAIFSPEQDPWPLRVG